MTGFNIGEECYIHESILFGFPWSSDDDIAIHYCMLYAKYYIYLKINLYRAYQYVCIVCIFSSL